VDGAREVMAELANTFSWSRSRDVMFHECRRRNFCEARGGRATALRQTMEWLIDEATLTEPATGRTVAAYAHPIFWAPFLLVGGGG
jgi:hypothetical protein